MEKCNAGKTLLAGLWALRGMGHILISAPAPVRISEPDRPLRAIELEVRDGVVWAVGWQGR